VRLDRRQRSPGLHFGVNGRHLLICLVQRLVRLRVVPLLLLVFRERLLVGRTVLLYLEHKVNNYSPIEKVKFRIRSKLKQETLPLALTLSLSLFPENSHLEQDNSI
jgi:hypothetical protein